MFFFGARKGRNVGKRIPKMTNWGSGIGLRVAHPLKNCQQHPSWMVCCGCKDKGTYLFCKKSVFFLNYDLNRKQETLIRIPATKLKSSCCLINLEGQRRALIQGNSTTCVKANKSSNITEDMDQNPDPISE